MNAFVRKEVRLLLPSFAAALLFSLFIWLMPTQTDASSGLRTFVVVVPFLLCPALVVMMSLDAFGRELSAGTFQQLLAQPMPRSRIWWTKAGLLGVSIITVLTCWLLSFAIHFRDRLSMPGVHEWRQTFVLTPALFALVVFAGGLWTVLFFRQVAAAFWFTLIVPAAIVMPFFYLLEAHPIAAKWLMIVTLVLYSTGGFLWARRLFLRAQDLQPTDGNIALPSWRNIVSGSRTAPSEHRSFSPRRALWKKEILLHQSHFVIAGVLFVLHLGVIATRRFVDLRTSYTADFVVQAFWVLWLAMPLLIGSGSVAEERKLGTLDGQLCLPATRRRQFILKFTSLLLLSALFSAVMPVLLEGKRVLALFDPHFGESAATYPDGYYSQFGHSLGGFLSIAVPFSTLAGIGEVIGAIAFYASTLTRNTLQALTLSVLGLLLAWVVGLGAANIDDVIHFPLWRGPLIFLLGRVFKMLM